jgi:hypothetical protein
MMDKVQKPSNSEQRELKNNISERKLTAEMNVPVL